MATKCEICENKEIKYLPYPIENEIYINITCFFCKEGISVCSLCKKYYYGKDMDDDYLIIPDKYKEISHSLSTDPHQCRKCMTINMRDKYKCCIMCTKYKNIDKFIFCNNCFEDSCDECNKNNICSVCELPLNTYDENIFNDNKQDIINKFKKYLINDGHDNIYNLIIVLIMNSFYILTNEMYDSNLPLLWGYEFAKLNNNKIKLFDEWIEEPFSKSKIEKVINL